MTESAEAANAGRSHPEIVVHAIKELITTGALSAGDRLPVEKDLAAQLGVSRGSLREGVRALATLGVLETRQGDGTYVTSLEPGRLLSPLGFLAELPSSADSAHLSAIRRVLEAESASRAAVELTDEGFAELDRILDGVDEILAADSEMDLEAFIEADAAFHREIARASGNPALAALIETLVSRTFRARLWRAITERGAVRDTQAEHRAVLRELRARDSARARIRMEAHILGVEDYARDRHVEPESESGSEGGVEPVGPVTPAL